MSENTTLLPGTSVLCTYRLPPFHDWKRCVGQIHVGVVEEPGTDPTQWNRTNSEANYCEVCKRTKVRYVFGIMHDYTENLIPLTAEQAALALLPDVEKYTLLSSLLPFTGEMARYVKI